MALSAAWALWVGVVAAGKVGHGVKSCDSQAKPCPGTVAWAGVLATWRVFLPEAATTLHIFTGFMLGVALQLIPFTNVWLYSGAFPCSQGKDK